VHETDRTDRTDRTDLPPYDPATRRPTLARTAAGDAFRRRYLVALAAGQVARDPRVDP